MALRRKSAKKHSAKKKTKKQTKKKHPKTPKPKPRASAQVACWEDDPGDLKETPKRTPIEVPVPNASAAPLPFRIRGTAPAVKAYPPGTPNFLYYGAACSLRRTADFWGGIVPTGTRWQVGAQLPIELDSGQDLNAFYTRGGFDAPGLHFFHASVLGRTVYSGEGPDVASHEMGHALLDAVQPELYDAQAIEAAAFHEAFGDMTAILTALQVASVRQRVLDETGGTLNHSSRVSRLAEQLGSAIRSFRADLVDPDCLRNASNSFFYRDPQTLPADGPARQLTSEPHSFSRVFTGGFLDALAGMLKLGGAPTSARLLEVSLDLGHILVGGVALAPVVPDYFTEVAAGMIHAGDGAPYNGKYRDALRSAFVRRGVLSLQAASALSRGASARRLEAAGARGAGAARPRRALPLVPIPAGHLGLTRPTLLVRAAGDPRERSVAGVSAERAGAEPRSAESAAQAYTEALFRRGHVDLREHAHAELALVNPLAFKSHVITQQGEELVLERIRFNCGLFCRG